MSLLGAALPVIGVFADAPLPPAPAAWRPRLAPSLGRQARSLRASWSFRAIRDASLTPGGFLPSLLLLLLLMLLQLLQPRSPPSLSRSRPAPHSAHAGRANKG